MTPPDCRREPGHSEDKEHAMSNTVKTVLRSDELSCPSCVTKIEKTLQGLSGVESAHVRFNTGRIEVDHDPQLATVDDLVQAVRRTGYAAKPATF
jgi:copper chaperone